MSEEKPGEKKKVSRRKFIVRGALGAVGVFALGTYIFRNPLRRKALDSLDTSIPPYSGSGTVPNLWFEITKDNQVILRSPKVEMGQGAFTGFAQLAADELEVDISQIQVVAAATSTGIVDGFTGASLSIAQLWMPLREMAATMREMIKVEAAKKMNVKLSDLKVKDGVISVGGKTMTYAEVSAGVTKWVVPETPELKPTRDYKFIGKPIPRIDLKAKVFGDPIFGMDASMPGMLHATVIRPTHIGASIESADTTIASAMPGVVKIIELDVGLGIIAKTYSQALAARDKVIVKWKIPKTWTEEDIRNMLQVGQGKELTLQTEGRLLGGEDSDLLRLEFSTPIGAHAQIEPNGAVASYEKGRVTVILSTQAIGPTQTLVAEAMGIETQKVNIIPTFLGGGFGRRLNTSHAIETAQMSKAVGKPVKYFFTRQEEFQHDSFRPPTHHIMRGKLSSEGMIDSIEHHFASGDVATNSVLMPAAVGTLLGGDFGAIRGGKIQYTNIPNVRAATWHQSLPFATSWWRSLGLLANTFAIESFVDEMALKAKKNPVEFRLAHLGDDETGKRIKEVIKVVAEKSGFRDDVFNGRAMGIAACIDANSPCAQVVEVSIVENEIKVHKVTCAFDCGLAVNPDQVRAQVEGCIIMGMSASLHEKMTITDGQLQPTIYGPYKMSLMKHAPKEINVHLIQGVDRPLPVGEPPLGPIGAAIANAVRRLTGKRFTDLPLTLT